MNSLNLVSGGAAHGLVASVAAIFREQTGFEISGEFGAVGFMADKLRAGAPADLVILTRALVAKLAEENLVIAGSIRDVGMVETALAVRAGDAKLSVSNADDLRNALLAADAIYVPDTKTSTAGLHVASVLDRLGIAVAVGSRLKIYPNGATAMRHLAACDAARPLGCTQSTEIIATSGVELSGSLPRGYDLATTYTGAITVQSVHAMAAQALIDLLTATEAAALRAQAGFLNVEA
ncbi:molybdate ABC transporter substrate-binding protein [Bradyrhizobium sp.]|uniref:molybdate ABC transporter substrate-binding protein n=1 Tax=Bradyrhizobium sp. TaxID=376 RepID=UPI0025C6516B|nr:substrate-binding domain-containing protein [Bradyrhizobium sp.]MBV8919989.1 substrate-binding domain-containing protein [Bradyrhizobium sp.]